VKCPVKRQGRIPVLVTEAEGLNSEGVPTKKTERGKENRRNNEYLTDSTALSAARVTVGMRRSGEQGTRIEEKSLTLVFRAEETREKSPAEGGVLAKKMG